jgi:hypothetical protein
MFRAQWGRQIDLSPPPPIDFENVVDTHPLVDAMLRPPDIAPRQRGLLEKLSDLPRSEERDQLIVELDSLLKKCEAFIAAGRSEQIGQLSAKRADLWAQCRAAEDETTRLRNEMGRLNNALNERAVQVNTWREKVRELRRPTFSSRFPTDAEMADWRTRQNAVRQECTAQESLHAELERTIASTESAYRDGSKRLNELIEQVQQLDWQLEAIRAEAKGS